MCPKPRPAPERGSSRRSGYTLVEMLTVVVLVAAIIAIALPNIEVARFRLNGEVQNIALAVNATQRLAVLRQYDIVLAFDADRRRIRVHHDQDNDGAFDSSEEVRFIQLEDEVVFGLGGADPLNSGDPAITFTETQDGMPALTFRRNGSASETGVIYLTSLVASRASGNSHHSRAIEIERATGQVTCMTNQTLDWEIGC